MSIIVYISLCALSFYFHSVNTTFKKEGALDILQMGGGKIGYLLYNAEPMC